MTVTVNRLVEPAWAKFDEAGGRECWEHKTQQGEKAMIDDIPIVFPGDTCFVIGNFGKGILSRLGSIFFLS